jgi:hypothetical protein
LGTAIKEEHRLRMFKKKVLEKISGPKRAEVTGGRRKVHNKDLNDLHRSPSIVKMIK